jgi:integrase
MARHMTDDRSAVPRKGGRRKGDSGHHNDGIHKRCPCNRKRWGDCSHDWWFSITINHQTYRFNMTKRAGLPRGKSLSRSEADGLRDQFRTLARDGKITRRGWLVKAATSPADEKTLRSVADNLIEHWTNDPKRRPHRVPILKEHLNSICRTVVGDRPFGERIFAELTTADMEAFRDARRRLMREREAELAERRRRIDAGDKEARKLPVSPEIPHAQRGEVGINRSLERLRALFNFAIARDLYPRENPFVKHGQPVIALAPETARKRRLQGDEEARLLQHASPELRDLIVAALDTGMRRRELLSLQWAHVLYDAKHQPKDLVVTAENSKTGIEREVPVLSRRFGEILLRRRLGPNGKKLPLTVHVFGNEVGEEVDNVKTSWRAACRRAGIEGLNFHDLRRECGSRWLEAGVGLLTVSYYLGHKKVTTTDTYLASSPTIRREELRAFEERRGNAFPNLSQTAATDPSGFEKAKEAVH